MRIFRRHHADTVVDEAPAPTAERPDPGTVRLGHGLHAGTRDTVGGHLDVLRYVLSSDPFDASVIETYITMATRIGSCDDALATEIRQTPRMDWPALRTTLAEVHLDALRMGIELLRSLPDPEPEDLELLRTVTAAMSDLTSAQVRGAPPRADAVAPPTPEALSEEDVISPGLEGLGVGDATARQSAIDAAVARGRAAVEALYHALESPSAEVREDARRALVRIGPVDELFAVAENADFEPIDFRVEIAGMLGEFDDPRAIELLIDIGARVDTGSRHRDAAAAALGHIGAPALERMLKLAVSPASVEQDLAAQALGLIGGDEAIGALIGLVDPDTPQRPQPFVRTSARRSLLRLTGQDLGTDADAWRKWFEDRGPSAQDRTSSDAD